ncbi:MAG: teichoic acid biosynthesis protein [Polyangiaceae bacterium]|nr:teichoic acid biosynthesis protein [Polyangiaceae bacterium]
MKILYGVVGEGMGHAMRSRVLLEHLVSKHHDVEIMASGRAVDFLAKRFSGVNRIHGLHMIYDENCVRLGKTALSNVVTSATGIPKNIVAYFELIANFRPQAVISDFESWTHLYGKMHMLPVLSIDNMQVINRCKLPDEIRHAHPAEFQITKAFIKGKLPFCDEYFITTFFRPPVRKKRTRLFPPILRPEILAAKPTDGDHLLVYTTGEGNEAFASTLEKTGLECRIYGMKRGITEEVVKGNLRYQPFSEDKFISDLASCRAVIAGGGFTLMGEAVYLHKPMLAVPVAGQFEQILNARYLEIEGFGRFVETLEDPESVLDFVAAIPECRDKLASYTQEGNTAIAHALDEWLDRAAVGLS